ncbi:Metalloendoproteinase 5-MMP [Sesamum alatum]|uniref:Metalloendoproteinase 5-MMP n=1 Tax=Sesamum alatum TaxID=300844 RepID=A0AAE2CEY4_9LAMI|nr:Metalloendoproteinase 5-MMP [Sesamum alatum]
MAPNLSSCIILIFFTLSCFTICHSSELSSETPLDFLRNLIGNHKGNQAKGLSKLKNYLANLGYTNPTNDDFFDDALELAIKNYQKFYNIKISGILDPKTVMLMLQPRCGVADFPTNPNVTGLRPFNRRIADHLASSYYTFSGQSWPANKRNLTFSFPVGTRTDAYAPVEHALMKWASVSPFNFTCNDNYNFSDVKISFQKRDHGDGYPFDGPYGILAHAFWPTDGRLHFDAEENWMAYAGKGGFDLQTVALHELGHILGLGHSQDPNALMFAYIGLGERKDLCPDDIQGIQSLYPS